jgi:hypothetical protein
VHTKNPQHGSPASGPVEAQPGRATMTTASSAMNDHRTLSPISEHPIRYPSPAAPGRTRRSLPRLRRRCPRRKIRLAAWRSRGRWARRPSPLRSSLRRGVDGSARQRTKSTALGPALGPIRLNYCSFFLVFSLADAVVHPIAEGGRRGNELGPDRPQPPLRTDVQILRSDQSAVDKAWTLPNAARKWRRHKLSEGYL